MVRAMSGDSRRIEDLANLGPFITRRLAEIGVTKERELRELGAAAVYVRLKFHFGREITLNALWALDAALSGIDWRSLSEARKAELRIEIEKSQSCR